MTPISVVEVVIVVVVVLVAVVAAAATAAAAAIFGSNNHGTQTIIYRPKQIKVPIRYTTLSY